jgi:hypothetical protein
MIPGPRRKELLDIAVRLAKDLAAFKTPQTSDSVDPSRLAEVFRFVKVEGVEQLPHFLKLMPGSYLRHASKSAAPQLEEIKRRVTPLVVGKNREELAFVLGWARRLLSVEEKTGYQHRDVGPRGSRP